MPLSKIFAGRLLLAGLVIILGQQGVMPILAQDPTQTDKNPAQTDKNPAQTDKNPTQTDKNPRPTNKNSTPADKSATPADNGSAPAAAKTAASASDLSTRPVNQKILPLIKEGYGYLSKGAYDKAIKTLKKAVAEDKDCISARRYLAYALIQKGQAKSALVEMQTVSRLVPPNAFDFYLFAAAYYAAGGNKEARDCYVEALRQNPAYDAARAGLVKTLARQQNFEEALSNVEQGMQLARDDAAKKYYASLKKAVVEAQTYQQSTNGTMPGAMSTLPAQVGGGSVKSEPVVIK